MISRKKQFELHDKEERQMKKTRLFLPDLGFTEEDYSEFYFEFWKDPSRKTVFDLLESVVQSVNDLQELSKVDQVDISERFFEACSRVILGTNIEGLCFDTPEDAKKSFSSPDLPWGFMYTVITSYTLRLLDTQQALKKTLEASNEILNSGENKETKE